MWLHNTSRYFPLFSRIHQICNILWIVPLQLFLVLLLIIMCFLALVNLPLLLDKYLAYLFRSVLCL